MEKINIIRIKALLTFFFILLLALAARAFYIQILSGHNLADGADSQQLIEVQGLDTRGEILDRNCKPLTGGVSQYYYFISKNQKNTDELTKLTESIDARQIASKASEYYVYRTQSYNKEVNEELKERFNAYVFQSPARYADEQIASHLIGYLNEDENKGVSGLELMYEDKLCSKNTSLMLRADGAGRVLRGYSPVIINNTVRKSLNSRNLVTSIDRKLQYIAEKSLKSHTKKGACLVMNSQTGEILAWVSLPSFNPNNVEDYLDSQDESLLNKVSQGTYAPGSVFKLVTAAAALEEGIGMDKTFLCEGEVTVEGVTLGCSTAPDGGHQEINMEEAMAHSCNCYFAQLGAELGYEKILDMARRMGYGERVFGEFPQELTGTLPSGENLGPWSVSNISIGQGEILATPLQVAMMTAIIANGGTKPEYTLELDAGVKGEQERVISEETALMLQQMMGLVMKEGTGKRSWEVPVYGKTGTAETGNDEYRYNCWFSGYCIINDNKYVVTVLAEDGLSGTTAALPVFEEIVSYFADSY